MQIKLRRPLFFDGVLLPRGEACPEMPNPPLTARCFINDTFVGDVKTIFALSEDELEALAKKHKADPDAADKADKAAAKAAKGK